MHMLIRGIVPAASSEGALIGAKHDVFDQLVTDGVFDFDVTADMDGHGVAGTDRWGVYPAAVPTDREQGQQLVEEGWQATVNEYEAALDRVEEFLESCDRCDLWEDEHTHGQYHYDSHRIGQFTGSSTVLYDQYGQGIRDRGHLDRAVSGDAAQDANPDDQTVYVVPTDVHW